MTPSQTLRERLLDKMEELLPYQHDFNDVIPLLREAAAALAAQEASPHEVTVGLNGHGSIIGVWAKDADAAENTAYRVRCQVRGVAEASPQPDLARLVKQYLDRWSTYANSSPAHREACELLSKVLAGCQPEMALEWFEKGWNAALDEHIGIQSADGEGTFANNPALASAYLAACRQEQP